jgi:hypothetical protein
LSVFLAGPPVGVADIVNSVRFFPAANVWLVEGIAASTAKISHITTIISKQFLETNQN